MPMAETDVMASNAMSTPEAEVKAPNAMLMPEDNLMALNTMPRPEQIRVPTLTMLEMAVQFAFTLNSSKDAVVHLS